MKQFFLSYIFYLKTCLCFICMMVSALSYGQLDNVWVFGFGAGLDFTGGSPIPFSSEIEGYGEANASVSDENGNLLFYTNGESVWNRNHQVMNNGRLILPTNINWQSGPIASSTSQGCLIIPVPDQPYRYYIFSLTSWEQRNRGNYGKLFYSVVDMSLSGGLGDVVFNERGILLDSLLTEVMTTVVGDRCNTWLLVCGRSPHQIKAYELTFSGLNTTPVVSDGIPTYAHEVEGFGCMTVSYDRKQLAITKHWATGTGNDGVSLFDFDLATGKASNYRQLAPKSGGYGISFSPDNSKLYYNRTNDRHLIQLDLHAGSTVQIVNSAVDLGEAWFTHLRMGPDQKIYLSGIPGNGEGRNPTNLSVINRPNLSDTSCQYLINSVSLNGDAMFAGLPALVPYFKRDSTYSFYQDSFSCFDYSRTMYPRSSEGWGHAWNTGDTSFSLKADTVGTYWVSYHAAPCTYVVDTIQVWFPLFGEFPELHIRSACKEEHNGVARLTKSETDTFVYTYVWRSAVDTTVLSTSDSLKGVPSGHYYVRFTLPDGCDTSLHFFIPKDDYQVSFEPSDHIVCIEDTIHFTNKSDPQFHTFYWSFGDQHTSDEFEPAHYYQDQGIYVVMLRGEGTFCADTFYHTIIVDTPVDYLTYDTDVREICMGESILFTPFTDSSATGLFWDFGDGTHHGSSFEKILHGFERSGSYYIYVEAHFRACPFIEYVDSIRVYPLPRVDLGPDSVICLHGSPVTLRNYYAYEEGDEYRWSTGSQQNTISVVHHGSYSLTVTNRYGCSNQESVRVDKDCYIDIPNAFTPNGDGLNDYFFPRQLLSEGVVSFEFKVFNRWGQLIFSTTSVEGRGWDGKFNGVDQPLGVYVYLMHLTFDNGRTEQYKGNVTLLR